MRRSLRRGVLLAAFAAAAVALLAVGPVSALFSSTSSNGGNTFSASSCFQPVPISIANFSFTPSTVTIARGCSVAWTQTSTTKHTSTSDTVLWDSGQLSQGQIFTRQFNTAGTFTYHCSFHPGTMAGTVIVN